MISYFPTIEERNNVFSLPRTMSQLARRHNNTTIFMQQDCRKHLPHTDLCSIESIALPAAVCLPAPSSQASTRTAASVVILLATYCSPSLWEHTRMKNFLHTLYFAHGVCVCDCLLYAALHQRHATPKAYRPHSCRALQDPIAPMQSTHIHAKITVTLCYVHIPSVHMVNVRNIRTTMCHKACQ